MHEGGLEKMYEFISETATYGDLVSGPRVVDQQARQRMREVLADIQTGKFARQWMAEHRTGRHQYDRLLKERGDHSIERVGRELRARMSWLEDQAQSDTGTSNAGDKAA
jgi:ketol-acid reductoisomerase